MIAQRRDLPSTRREYHPDIDVLEELSDHLVNPRENHRLDLATLPFTKIGLTRIHLEQHREDLDADYIVSHIKMFEL